MQGQNALLLHALGWDELDVGPRGGFTDRRGIGRVVLLSLLHERLDGFGCNQLHRMTKTSEYAGPVMGSATGLHHDRAGRLLLKKRDQLAPAQLPLDLRLSSLVHAWIWKTDFAVSRPIMVMLIVGGSLHC